MTQNRPALSLNLSFVGNLRRPVAVGPRSALPAFHPTTSRFPLFHNGVPDGHQREVPDERQREAEGPLHIKQSWYLSE